MIVSEARIAANKRNASRSTGPKTLEGKARIRANALQHGMTADSIDDTEIHRLRAAEWTATLQPIDATEEWLVDEIARITLKLDHAGKVERNLRDQAAIRAEVCWDGDRRAEVEVLARRLSDRPGETVAQLERSVHGCEFLMERWMMLADVAEHRLEWDEPQIRLAFDLMGTPIELRGSNPCVRLDAEGTRVANPLGQAGFARAEAERLKALRDDLAGLDEFERSGVILGLDDASTPELRRFRRYETSLQNRLKWCLKQFGASKPAAVAPVAAPEPIATPVEQAPREVMPDRLPTMAASVPTPNLPTAPTTRADQKLDRAASRREAKKRKLDRRRA